MTDGAVVASLTHAINVKAAPATKKEVVFLDTCAVQGAGVFVRINVTAMGLTPEQLKNLERTVEITTGSFTIQNQFFQGDQCELYVVMSGAPVGNPLAIKVTFKDTASNIVYEGTVNFKDDKVARTRQRLPLKYHRCDLRQGWRDRRSESRKGLLS